MVRRKHGPPHLLEHMKKFGNPHEWSGKRCREQKGKRDASKLGSNHKEADMRITKKYNSNLDPVGEEACRGEQQPE